MLWLVSDSHNLHSLLEPLRFRSFMCSPHSRIVEGGGATLQGKDADLATLTVTRRVWQALHPPWTHGECGQHHC
jgi:hypothetical protein